MVAKRRNNLPGGVFHHLGFFDRLTGQIVLTVPLNPAFCCRYAIMYSTLLLMCRFSYIIIGLYVDRILRLSTGLRAV